MGLDMYLYRISRISSSEQRKLRGLKEDEIRQQGYSIFHKPSKHESDLLKNIMPYLRGIKIPMEYFDMKKIIKDFKIPRNALPCGSMYAHNQVKFDFCSPDYKKSYVADLNSHELIKKYTYTKLTNCYVSRVAEIGYWRKNYDLQDKIYQAADLDYIEIENCGYYPLTDGMAEAILNDDYEYSKKVKPHDLICDENSVICYHEWY